MLGGARRESRSRAGASKNCGQGIAEITPLTTTAIESSACSSNDPRSVLALWVRTVHIPRVPKDVPWNAFLLKALKTQAQFPLTFPNFPYTLPICDKSFHTATPPPPLPHSCPFPTLGTMMSALASSVYHFLTSTVSLTSQE